MKPPTQPRNAPNKQSWNNPAKGILKNKPPSVESSKSGARASRGDSAANSWDTQTGLDKGNRQQTGTGTQGKIDSILDAQIRKTAGLSNASEQWRSKLVL